MYWQEVYYKNYKKNRNKRYWELEERSIPYMVLIKDKDERMAFLEYLSENGLECVYKNDTFAGVLVNLELARFCIINAPCHHGCIGDRYYSKQEFIDEVFLPRLKDGKAMKDPLKDKYISIMGDSISAFEGFVPTGFPSFYSRDHRFTGINSYKDMWWYGVITRFGAKLLVNNSWSGSFVCAYGEISSYACHDDRASGLGAGGVSPDHIIVFIGTNDRGHGFPLTSEDKTDLKVIENAYGMMLDKLKKNYPNAEIWCCTFPRTVCRRELPYEIIYTRPGTTFEDYVELVKNVAQSRECHVIDLWDNDNECDTSDGLHPNYIGMRMIEKKVITAIERWCEKLK